MQVFPSIIGVDVKMFDGDIYIYQRYDENDTDCECVVIPGMFAAQFKKAFASAVQQAKDEGWL